MGGSRTLFAAKTVVTGQGLRRWGLVLALIAGLTAVPITIDHWPVRAAGIEVGALRARVTASAGQAFQGYAQSTGLLPLPTLPNLSEMTALASGTTEMRAWYAAPDRWRVDVLGEGTERDLYQTPQAQFTWDFGANQLTRVVGGQPVRLPRAADLTPPALVRRVLAISTGDRVEPLPAKRVAGLAAAGMRLVPNSPDTTVAHVDIWADPVRGLPLRAEVTAKGGSRPVFVTRFLEIHFGVPAASVLTPPPRRPGVGYTVTEAPDIISAINRRRPVVLPAGLAGLPRRDSIPGLAAVAVYGTGLASIVVIGLPGRFGRQAYQQIETYGQEVKVPGDSAASLLTTGLLSLLAVRADDRVFLVAGLVGAPLMQRVAGSLTERGR